LESWLESNPDSIVEDGKLCIIGRQVLTTFGSFIDLLALDRAGNVVVLEMKRDRTPRDTLAQALEYASFAERLDYQKLQSILQDYTGDESTDLSEYHRLAFDLKERESISFNKDQRIVIIGHDIAPEIRQTAIFLRTKGIVVTCVEFDYFKTESDERLITSNIVVGREPLGGHMVESERSKQTDREKFLRSCDDVGRPVFEALLAMAEAQGLPRHWGSIGFSLNADVNGKHVSICKAFPPSSVYDQSIYSTLNQIAQKIEGANELVGLYRKKLEQTGLFSSAGNEVKCAISKRMTNDQISVLTGLFSELAAEVKNLGLAEMEHRT